MKKQMDNKNYLHIAIFILIVVIGFFFYREFFVTQKVIVPQRDAEIEKRIDGIWLAIKKLDSTIQSRKDTIVQINHKIIENKISYENKKGEYNALPIDSAGNWVKWRLDERIRARQQ